MSGWRHRVWLLLVTMLAAACAGVLGIRPEQTERPFEHRAHVNKGVACTVCHAGMARADERPELHLPSQDVCLSCHKSPHKRETCSNCHGERHARQATELTKRHLRFEHRKHTAAGAGACPKCHTPIGVESDGKLNAPMAACFTCHQHDKQFAARACDACHVDLPAERVLPASHIVHDNDFVREHGVRAAAAPDLCATCHSERSCLACHGVGTTPGLPARLSFDKPSLTGVHRAGFRSRHSEEARANAGLCTSCHSERTCSDCHAREGVGAGGGRRSPHPAGWLTGGRGGEHGAAARLDPMSCASCHSGAGEQLCIGCHRVGGPGGNPHGHGFESRKDKLNDVPCRYCHRVGP